MPVKAEQSAPALWSVPLAVADVPQSGLHRQIEAGEAARALVAKAGSLRNVSRLVARFDISPMAGGRFHVGGHVSALVGQNCVVTLEPLDAEIEEDIDVVFAPGPQAAESAAGGAELDIGAEAVDPPEPLIGGMIDLGALATEFVVLGINPYPRKPDVVFTPPSVSSDPETHPFAALQALKDKPLKS